MTEIICDNCEHDIREHHRSLGCFGGDEGCPCGLDEVAVAKIALTDAKLAASRRPGIGSEYGPRKCRNLACGVLTYAAEWCPGCGVDR